MLYGNISQYYGMFMQQVNLKSIGKKIEVVNRKKAKFECLSVLLEQPKLFLVDADSYGEICYCLRYLVRIQVRMNKILKL